MSDSTTKLDLIAASQAQKEVTANALFDAASPAMLYGRRAAATAGLTWGYYGGSIIVSGAPLAVANGTITLTASATNYVEVDPATGTVSKNTTAFTAGRVPLYQVVTGASSVTSYTDVRNGLIGVAAVLADGDKGDIVVSSSGATWTIDSAVLSTFGRSLIDDVDAAAARVTLGLGTAATLAADTDTTLAANSDTRTATQKAVKAYVDAIATSGATDVMIFKGVIDCSANPNYPAANAGNLYKVSVAGKIGGASGPNVEAGDTLYCIADGTAAGTHASVGASWVIAQVNLDGAVIGPASATDSNIAAFDGTTGKLIKDSGKAHSTDGTFTANSDALIPTQKAVKTYVTAAISGVGGGLTNFSEAANSSTPNATVPVVSLTANNAATNVDIALRPKGTGALTAAIADNATTGGNKRGTYAVDWQTTRTAAASVASGNYSVVCGGNNNKASADYSTVSGGGGNSATNTYTAVIGGNANSATATGAAVGGYTSIASGICALAFGETVTASGQYAVSFGYNSAASANHSYTLGDHCAANALYSSATGYYASTRSIIGARAHTSSAFNLAGECQEIRVVLSGQTTNATPKVLTANQSAAGTTNQLTVQSNSSITVTGRVVARAGTSGDTASWTFSASIKRGASTAAMVAACTPVLVAADSGASSWALSVTADTTNNALAVTFTGAASTSINIYCSLEGVEVVKA